MLVTPVPLDDLAPDPRNARRHNLDRIAAALADGMLHPLVARRTPAGLVLVVGHGRRAALARMRSQGLPAPRGCEGWCAPTVIVEMSPQRAARHLYADNAASDASGWHSDELDALLDELRASSSDLLSAFGHAPDLPDLEPPDLEAYAADEGGVFRDDASPADEPTFRITITWPSSQRAQVLAALARGMRETHASTYADLVMRLLGET